MSAARASTLNVPLLGKQQLDLLRSERQTKGASGPGYGTPDLRRQPARAPRREQSDGRDRYPARETGANRELDMLIKEWRGVGPLALVAI